MEKKQPRYNRIVESDLATPTLATVKAQVTRPETSKHLLIVVGTGLALLALVVAGIWIALLSIVDATQEHPLSSWHQVLAFLDSAKGWLIALVILLLLAKWGIPGAWHAFKAWHGLKAEERRLAAE